MPLLCPYTCDWHTHLQILSNWRSPYLRPSVGFANGISQYLTKYSSLCLNGSMYTLYHLTYTMILMYLVHRTHILSTMLTAHNILLTQMCDKLNNWLRQPSCFLVSSPLDISNFSFTLFLDIGGPSGLHVLGKIVKIFANFVKCMISLLKKPESFQRLQLDLHLICSKQLINSLTAIRFWREQKTCAS